MKNFSKIYYERGALILEDNAYVFLTKSDVVTTLNYLKSYKMTIDTQITTIKAIPFQKKMFNKLIEVSSNLSILIDNLERNINRKEMKENEM